MFKRFFKGMFKEEKHIPSESSNRDLFNELFPLTEENQTIIKNEFNSIFEKMFSSEGQEELKNYSRNYSQNEVQLGRLAFSNMNWELQDSTETKLRYINNDGDVMMVDVIEPHGKMEKEHANAIMLAYRDWTRDNSAKMKGGLIMCEDLITENGIIGYESITKVPKKEAPGMNYVYFLNLNNYEEQKMYQFRIMVLEMNPTGLRDSVSIDSICKIAETDMLELMDLYRKDPYNSDYKEGNLMNLSEKKEFDQFFPFHPLSIIRNEIRPHILNSIKFK